MVQKEILEEATNRKLRGNEFFKAGSLQKAIKCYSDSLALSVPGSICGSARKGRMCIQRFFFDLAALQGHRGKIKKNQAKL